MGEKYASISEMLSASNADDTLIEEVEQEIRKREVVTAIAALRASKGMTQSDVAERIGCSQSRISKIEASCDEDLKLGDLAAYLQVIDMDLAMLLHPSGKSMPSRVKFHAMCVKRELKKLVGLSNGDDAIAKGAASFLGESLFNFLKIVLDAQKGLPEQARPSIRLEVIETSDDCSDDQDAADAKNQIATRNPEITPPFEIA